MRPVRSCLIGLIPLVYHISGVIEMAIPYAPSRQYVPDNSIIDIIMQAARQKADSQREGGAIWGNTVGNLGKIASGTIRDIAEGKAIAQEQERKAMLEAPRLADEAKLRGLNIQRGERELAEADKEAQRTAWFESKLQSGEMPKPAEVMAMMGEKRGFDVIKGIGLLQPDGAARYSDQAKVLRDAARAVKALPAAAQPAAWGVMRSSLMSQGAVDESMVPEAFDPNLLDQAAAFGQEPAKAPEAFNLSPGQVRYGGDGKVIASLPKEPKAPEYREIEGKMYEIRGGKAIPVQVQGGAVTPTAPAEASFISQPAFQKLAPPAKTQVVKAAELINTAKEYRKLVLDNVDDSGLLLTGPMAAEIDSAHGNLAFKGAGGYGQGALQAPDREVMEQIFANPASFNPKAIGKTTLRGGKAGIKRALDSAVKRLEDDLFRVYGLRIDDVAPLEKGTTVAAPDKSAPAQWKSVGGYKIREKS